MYVRRGARLRHVAVQLQREAQRLMREQAIARVHRQPMNLLRCLGGHLLDVDAAGGAHHQHGALGRSVDDDAHVALRGDIGRGRHEHLAHREALDGHAQDLGGVRRGLVRVRGELHAAGLAPPAGVYLGFDDDAAAAEAQGDRASLGGRRGDLPGRHRDALPPQDVARLVFVEIHTESLVMVVPASPCNAASPCASSAMMARWPRPPSPARTKAAAASTFGRMLPVPSSFPASR